jgi:hypothetical protein
MLDSPNRNGIPDMKLNARHASLISIPLTPGILLSGRLAVTGLSRPSGYSPRWSAPAKLLSATERAT